MFFYLFSVCAVIPFLLVICQYAGADKIFPDQFNELPFLPKENLISYHTEGIGEDKVGSHVCLGNCFLCFFLFLNIHKCIKSEIFFVLFNVDM